MNYRRLSLLLIALLGLLLAGGAAADSSPFAPTLPPIVRGQDPMNPHPATTDIPTLAADYTLSATIGKRGADGKVHVDGTERIRLTDTGMQPVARVTFNAPAVHYGWFGLDGSTIDGVPTAVDQAEVRFTFPDWPGIAPGETRTVGFTFHLDIGNSGDGFDGTRLDGDILRLAYWFPMLSDDHGYPEQIDPPYTATGNFHVTLVAPAAETLAGTGVIRRQETAGERTTYTIDAPNVRDFVAFLSPSYQVARARTSGNVAVEVYTVPSHVAQAGRVDEILNDAVRSIEQMSSMVGPYPYPVFRVVDAGLTMPGGIEFPMVASIGTGVRGTAILIAHETAHQWFYGLLGTHTQAEPWVDEGAASFFEQAIYAGPDVAVMLPRALPCPVSATVWDDVSPKNLYYCVYDGGRVLYAAIRDTMGTDRFLAALHDLYARDRYGIISAREMLVIFQQHSATDLRPILRAYLAYDWLDALPAPGG